MLSTTLSTRNSSTISFTSLFGKNENQFGTNEIQFDINPYMSKAEIFEIFLLHLIN